MSADLLLEQFATLATAPDGIARLRELILQLAVQGKFGTQDAGDEPASVLLKKILKDKDLLVKAGKIPKEKPIEYEDESIFNQSIPEHWILVRLGEISDKIHYGYTASADSTIKRVRLLRITDIQNNRVNWDLVPGCEIDDSNFLSYSINAGDLLIARTGGTVGKSFLVREQPVPAVFASYLIRVVPNQNLNQDYVKLFADSPTYWDQLHKMCMGTGQPNVNGMALRSLIVPLPPLAEQHRIVAKVDRLMALCDELEARQQQERVGCLKLGTASLAGLQNAESPEEFGRQWAQVCDAFDLILDCPENVAVLRQTILQLAVQGRLVRQEPGDEPAKKLVERIRSNKSKLIKEGIIKKEKVIESVKTTEELFSLPPGWSWIKLYDLITFGIRNGYSPLPAVNTTNTKVLTLSATTRGVFDNRYYKYLSEKIDENSHLWLTEGDILIQRSNTPGYVGISAIYHGDSNLFIYPDMMMKFRLSEEVNSDFIHKAINCEYSRKYFTSKAIGTSSSMKKINQNIVENLIIPLPPLTEQHRIVAKVDALMKLCDALESRLKERAGVQDRLAGAVVKQVAG
ncbi:restriction endonuclease subunit S [Methanoregula sp.]|uniref:restriction endonuclease subunit S n=1 Tax=Methanoregula sp. TaxID=2052170 RepID=UPI003565B0FE